LIKTKRGFARNQQKALRPDRAEMTLRRGLTRQQPAQAAQTGVDKIARTACLPVTISASHRRALS
jgi:hypothetical protein